MTNITVSLPDDRLRKLLDVAKRFGVSPEELLRVTIEEILAHPDDAFSQAAEYVLKKNFHLYDRLS